MVAGDVAKPVQHRTCGPCNACCSAFMIDEPALKKVPNVLCDHWSGGCKIYESRPQTCRQFLCGWMMSSRFGEHWRPDQSNIVVRVLAQSPRMSVVFHLLGSLTEEMTADLLHTIGGMIIAGNETFLAVAGGPGENAVRISLNPAMAQAIESRDINAARAILNLAIQESTQRPKTRSHLEAPQTA